MTVTGYRTLQVAQNLFTPVLRYAAHATGAPNATRRRTPWPTVAWGTSGGCHVDRTCADLAGATLSPSRACIASSRLRLCVLRTMPTCESLSTTTNIYGYFLQLPSSCPRTSYGGFELQHCLGHALALRLETVQSSASSSVSERLARTAICVARDLVANGLLDDCHLVAHAIGHALVRQSSSSGILSSEDELAEAASKVIPQCPERACTDGCVHAVMISLLAHLFHDRAIRPDSPTAIRKGLAIFNAACGPEPTYSCEHGLGHGIGGLVTSGLIRLDEGLAMCSHIAAHQYTCEGGFTMEIVGTRVAAAAAAAAAAAPGNSTLHAEQALQQQQPLQQQQQQPAAVFAVHSLCHGFPQRLSRWCFEHVGEALAFATCHDLALSTAACEQEGDASKPRRASRIRLDEPCASCACSCCCLHALTSPLLETPRVVRQRQAARAKAKRRPRSGQAPI